MAPSGGTFPIDLATRIIRIGITNELKTSSIGIPMPYARCMPKIPKNAFHGLHVCFLGVCLEASTHANTKHDIGPRCGKVKQRTDHRTVKSLVYWFTSLIKVEMPISCHRGLAWFAILHLEALEKVLSIFFLTNKGAFIKLLDLKSKKEG